MTGLWQAQHEANRKAAEPLAVRMRPRNLAEFVGQEHFLSEGKLLRRMLAADRLTSVIFYGPPGVGKTSLAEVIALHTQRRFESASAAEVGVAEVRRVLDTARRTLETDGVRTIFFLDEIHRFSRAQQDVLLGDVERGIVTLIGATTENPFFAVNAPLVSRSQIFQFEPLTEEQIATLIRRALQDPDRGYGRLNIQVSDEAIAHWARVSDGDARRAIAASEVAVLSGGKDAGRMKAGKRNHPADPDQPLVIDLDTAEQSIQRKALVYDPTGDQHYDCASALIKSMRGSDPDAAVYWLARMLESGEDPRFIARRIAILASEDIGNADPQALCVAAAAYEVTERIGMPECQLTLAQAAIYMATAPKSNASAAAIWQASKDVKDHRTVPVPRPLRDGHYAGAHQLGNAQGYQYAHNSPTGYVPQEYLGVDKTYYQPTDRGYEQQISAYLEWVRQQNDGQTPKSD
jgi:putative ATPase